MSEHTRATKDRIRSKAGARRKSLEKLGDQFSAAAATVHDDGDLGRMARAYVKLDADIRLGRARP